MTPFNCCAHVSAITIVGSFLQWQTVAGVMCGADDVAGGDASLKRISHITSNNFFFPHAGGPAVLQAAGDRAVPCARARGGGGTRRGGLANAIARSRRNPAFW